MSFSSIQNRIFGTGTCIVAACTLFLSLATAAQTPQPVQTGNGTVRGTVMDPDAAIIPGAAIVLTPASGKPVNGTSGSDGTYRMAAPAGIYTMTVSMPGFATMSKAGLKITAGQSIMFDAKLIIGDQTTTINVTSEAVSVSVDADSNASSTIIKGADLDALSDDPDELSAELSALAGPAAGPNGGQIYVDGFTGGQLPPKSSIREIRINQNPFSAEYDKLGYGRVEVFTKPGTDKFHGSLSTQGNDGAFNTSNPFLGSQNSQPGYHQFFLLGNMTGPLTKSASFSIGGSRRTIQTNLIVNPTGFYSTSATSTVLCPPGQIIGCSFFAGYPVGSRAVFQPQTRSDITPRIDLALGKKNVLTARYQYEGASTQNSGSSGSTLPTAFTNTSSNEHTVQISDTQTFNSKVVNETRFEYQHTDSNNSALGTTPSVSVNGTFNGGSSGSQTSNTTGSHIEVQNYTSVALSKHFLRFGGRVRSSSESILSNAGTNGSFTYQYLLDPCTDPNLANKPSGCAVAVTQVCATANLIFSSYQCGVVNQFAITTINRPTVSARETDVGLYLEDDWKIRSNFTFSAGIRFETENVIHSTHDFAPRFSTAYGIPRSSGKPPMTVIRGGFGIFYDRFSLGDIMRLQQLSATNPAQTSVTVVNPGTACTPTSFGSCTGSVSPQIVTSVTASPTLRSAYTLQGAFGIDQQVGKVATLSLNYLTSRGDHEFYTRVSRTPTTQTNQYQSEGVFNQNQIFLNGTLRAKKVTLFGFYALGFANTNAGSSTFVPTSTNSRVDYGRAAFNARNSGTVGGSWNAPFKITASPYLTARSGSPYNVTTGTDVNGDLVYNDRPEFANGTSANCFNASTFITPPTGTTNYQQIPINYCTGPASLSFNLRVSRTFGFGPKLQNADANGQDGSNGRHGGSGGMPPGAGSHGGGSGGSGGPGGGGGGGGSRGGGMGGGGNNTGRRYNLTMGAQAQNLFNDVNYGQPQSVLTNPQFGKETTIQSRPFGLPNAVRVITLQATFTF